MLEWRYKTAIDYLSLNNKLQFAPSVKGNRTLQFERCPREISLPWTVDPGVLGIFTSYVRLLRIPDAPESHRARPIVTRRHQQQLSMLIVAVRLRKVPL